MNDYDYHKYGVNVKVYSYPKVEGIEKLSDDILNGIFDNVAWQFWTHLDNELSCSLVKM